MAQLHIRLGNFLISDIFKKIGANPFSFSAQSIGHFGLPIHGHSCAMHRILYDHWGQRIHPTTVNIIHTYNL
jgi:hypothetical protein